MSDFDVDFETTDSFDVDFESSSFEVDFESQEFEVDFNVGIAGNDGDHVRLIYLYQASVSMPSAPTNGFDADTGVRAADGDWVIDAPTPSGNQVLWLAIVQIVQSQGSGTWSLGSNTWDVIRLGGAGSGGGGGISLTTI